MTCKAQERAARSGSAAGSRAPSCRAEPRTPFCYPVTHARAARHRALSRGARPAAWPGSRSSGCGLATRSSCGRSHPAPAELAGRTVLGFRRMGKRIVFVLADELFVVLHLMIAGRLRWRDRGARDSRQGWPGGVRLSHRHGHLHRSRARSGRRRSISSGRAGARRARSAGLEVLTPTCPTFAARLRQENHTLKRALTDPHIFSGIGNAYSDEILHAARLSPMKTVAALTDDEVARLVRGDAARRCSRGSARLRDEAGGEFPEKVTAFRRGHGRSRPLWSAVPGLRRAGPAHRLRAQRGQLLQRAARPAAGCCPTARCRGC